MRVDNADERLTGRGLALGCISPVRAAHDSTRRAALDDTRRMLESVSLTPTEAQRHGITLNRDGIRRSAFQLLSYPEITWDQLAVVWPQLRDVPPALADRLCTDATYAVYLDRQRADIAAFRRDEAMVLPALLDYGTIAGLSNELRLKLDTVRPVTLGQAARIEGVTPAALTLLAAHARRRPAAQVPAE